MRTTHWMVVTLALTGLCAFAGCKSDCDRMIEHTAHLAWQETLKNLTAEQKEKTAGLMPSEEQMMPVFRKIGLKRFGSRCGDPALTRCILAATDSFAIGKCDQHDTGE